MLIYINHSIMYLFGPNDNFNLESSHAIPGLIRKLYNIVQENENTFTVMGTGKPFITIYIFIAFS